ncbi:MAG: ATP-binding protein [Actinobacteria bacterium]|nr:ATP-binding protein [Actinomycetota bacterium]
MYRNEIKDLIEWKNSTIRKPLILRGARQVGKTWLCKEFGKTHFRKCAYINFEDNERMKDLFSMDYDIGRIITGLQVETGINIDSSDTLIVFDEVQEVPRALTSLKYFYENAPQYFIIAAGSLLGIALHPDTSFPVGKVSFLNLYPLSFVEFVSSVENESLLIPLKNLDTDLITNFKSKYIDLLRKYYFVGGMPEVVSTFIETKDYAIVRKIQETLLFSYEQDFSKHAPNEIVPRIRQLWHSISAQLAKENRKFVYGIVKKGARGKDFEVALQWLVDSGLIYKVNRISKPGIPLSAYKDSSAFKLFMVDIGLLSAISRLDFKTLLEGSRVFEEFKGALTEQYVLQQLISSKKISPFYWSSEKGSAEVDFVFQKEAEIFPLEVKASENLQSKSLKSYYQKYLPKYSLRVSMSDFRMERWLINIPLYSINILYDFLGNMVR